MVIRVILKVCLLTSFLIVFASARDHLDPYFVEWETPTAEPSFNKANQPIIGGGMPLGNGEANILVFPLVQPKPLQGTDFILPDGSVSFFVSAPTAMASDTTLFKLGMVSVVTTPSLFDPSVLPSFKQKFNASDASVTVSSSVGDIRVWVDANSNLISAKVTTVRDVDCSVTLQSVHPTDGPFTYGGGFGLGDPISSPDILFNTSDAMGITHRNVHNDYPAAFNATLKQQGLEHLIEKLQHSDRWQCRQFGMLVSANTADASPHELKPFSVSPSSDGRYLISHSRTAGRSFLIEVSLHINQTTSGDQWKEQMLEIHRANTDISYSERCHRLERHQQSWSERWERSSITVYPSLQRNITDDDAFTLNQQYILTRFINLIQSGTWVPIKFNGQLFNAGLPPETTTSGPSYRDWGANSWWQNTRLPYWTMAPSRDFENMATVLEFFLQMLPFSEARTREYFHHDGVFYTETKTLFGAFAPNDYGPDSDSRLNGTSNLPVYLESNGYIHYDYGGDGGTLEIAMLVHEHWMYSQDVCALKRYMPIAVKALDFFVQHYTNRSDDDRVVIWPTQSLETYWCAFDTDPWYAPNASNCLSDDHPTVAGLHVVFEKVLSLPTNIVDELLSSGVITVKQWSSWQHFYAALPDVPLIEEGGVLTVSPYATYPNNSALHNSETPELYSTHPFRYFTIGREITGNRSTAPSLACLIGPSKRQTCLNGAANTGWTQGVLNAALLAQSDLAMAMVMSRAHVGGAHGYRFSAFAPHEQDYEPSADHYSNMASALQYMLLQPADDLNMQSLAFAAWPCDIDVDFVLGAPGGATVSASLRGGHVTSLDVQPESRRKFVLVADCE